MKTALDLVENDLVTLTSTLRAAFALVASHPNYSKTNTEDGEMLSDIGVILFDSAKRLQGVYESLDGQEIAA